jgi:hypothetical protein
MTMAALASLTANYTDSEEEDDNFDKKQRESKDSGAENAAAGTDEGSNLSAKSSLAAERSRPGSAASTPAKKTRLVSYGAEGDDDDNDVTKSDGEVEGGDDDSKKSDGREDDVISMELDSENNGEDDDEDNKEEAGGGGAAESEKGATQRQSSAIEVEAWTGGVQLPREPPGVCPERLQMTINKMYKQKEESGYDLNAVIQNKKNFRNPSIYEKLIQFCDIDEHGTNFPKELYDGHLFGPDSYYDELAKVQAAEMERREKKAAAAKSSAVGHRDDIHQSFLVPSIFSSSSAF